MVAMETSRRQQFLLVYKTRFDFQTRISLNISERAEKGIARHVDASSVVWTLIDNGKLANQIARLIAIVVK